MSAHKIVCGKSEIELKQFDDNSFDSCVTDPPYGLEFMGKDWDKFKKERFGKAGEEGENDLKVKKNFKILPRFFTLDLHAFQQFTYQWATELYRVMKPGAHILVFGGTRTYHRMACAIEDAGFEIRDMVEWFYGSGFPKSLDISKSIDKMKGKEREVISKNLNARDTCGIINICKKNGSGTITAPTTEEAIQWDGWGTGLKPAHEPILLARKPISERNIASNMLKWGVGGLNIDSCRIKKQDGDRTKYGVDGIERSKNNTVYGGQSGIIQFDGAQGRFPANLILDEEAGKMLDEQSGELQPAKGRYIRKHGNIQFLGMMGDVRVDSPNGVCDYGGASRFFYQAKAPQNERWFYCTICKQAYPMKERDKHVHNAPEKEQYKYLEFHPTQKPEALISYLARLITPPNGNMLDPFLGSGTGLIAAEQEGFNCTGIDSKQEYCLISYQRLKSEIEQAQTKLTGEQSKVTRMEF